MKAKKLILLFLAVTAHILNAGIIHHALISVTEQKIMGHVFKHIMTSNLAEKDEFFIDNSAVTKEMYQQEFEANQKKERDAESMQQEISRRGRLQFVEMMQIEIAAKLLHKLLGQVAQLFVSVHNPALEKFFVFTDGTIDSHDQLMQLKSFTDQLHQLMQQKVEHNDFESLNAFYAKLEYWPVRLEKFFQDTVKNAIKKSDDTTMLKELLKLVSESSLIH